MKVWAARDKDGDLFMYDKKPEKRGDQWFYPDCRNMMYVPEWAQKSEMKQIKWKDKEPVVVEIKVVKEKGE